MSDTPRGSAAGPTFDEAVEEFFGLCRVDEDDTAIVCGYPPTQPAQTQERQP